MPARLRSAVAVLPISTVPAFPAVLLLPIPARVIVPAPSELLISIVPIATPELPTSPITPLTVIDPAPVSKTRLRAVPEPVSYTHLTLPTNLWV